MDLGGIIVGLFSAVIVKGTVMVLSAVLVLRLHLALRSQAPARRWIAIPERCSSEVRVLWWSLVLFLLSEIVCAMEVFVPGESAPLVDGAHGMISGFGTGLFALGVLLILDKKLLAFGQHGCLGNRFCQGCTMGGREGCKLNTTLLLLAAFIALATLPALIAPARPLSADLRRYALPFESLNQWFDVVAVPYLESHLRSYRPAAESFYVPGSSMIIELRILPSSSLLVALLGAGLLMAKRSRQGLRVLAFAFGVLAYVYLELVALSATRDAVMGSVGHEVAELWFLIVTAEWLRRSFPKSSGDASDLAASGQPTGTT